MSRDSSPQKNLRLDTFNIYSNIYILVIQLCNYPELLLLSK